MGDAVSGSPGDGPLAARRASDHVWDSNNNVGPTRPEIKGLSRGLECNRSPCRAPVLALRYIPMLVRLFRQHRSLMPSSAKIAFPVSVSGTPYAHRPVRPAQRRLGLWRQEVGVWPNLRYLKAWARHLGPEPRKINSLRLLTCGLRRTTLLLEGNGRPQGWPGDKRWPTEPGEPTSALVSIAEPAVMYGCGSMPA
jgi:hypothetical protein